MFIAFSAFPAQQTWGAALLGPPGQPSEVQDGQQTLTDVYWTKSCNQARQLVTTLAVKT